MPLSRSEIRTRANAFVREWKNESRETAEAQTFWNEFFNVFGLSRRSVAVYEAPVKKLGDKRGEIDLFWKGTLIAEHKSRGKDLDSAYEQALEYFPGLKRYEEPKYVIVSDFARIRLYDLETGTDIEFRIEKFTDHLERFDFIAGYQKRVYKEQDPVNVDAAEKLGRLHDALKESGYDGHDLEVLLVRIMFCLFADDTGIFPRDQFQTLLETKTREDGFDLGSQLGFLFKEVLNKDIPERQSGLDDDWKAFPYVNGGLFKEDLQTPACSSEMRAILLECCALDWGQISPAIFGAMFQSVMDAKARRNLGAHYTSEKNILKLIHPLFLDDLRAEFEAILKGTRKLENLGKFHAKISDLAFLDPACGCGNFLIVSYRELRRLEIEVIKAIKKEEGKEHAMSFGAVESKVNVDQFYGIEIVEFSAQIARTALWLMDHVMNLEFDSELGQFPKRLPLTHSATIVHGDALQTDWESVVPKTRLSYILGNPPFIGSKLMTEEQRAGVAAAFGPKVKSGVLDFVTAWYALAARYIQGTNIKVAFVSTNSITQGEQVGILWQHMLDQGIQIHFAHRTFRWNNEAKGIAAVFCVIIGFAIPYPAKRRLFDYETVSSEPHEIAAANISPYLVDAPSVLVMSRSKPLCSVPAMGIGNKPIDGGNYLFDREQKTEFIRREPRSEALFRRWLGSEEFINGLERWCLWVGDTPPETLRSMPLVLERIENVRKVRLESKSEPTRKLAATPTRFHVENMPKTSSILFPRHSSEARPYMPLGFVPPDILIGDSCLILSNATPYHFGVLTSQMHMAWMRAVCGRLKSDYRYSKDLVYNNFPWPKALTPSPSPLRGEGGPFAAAQGRLRPGEGDLVDLRRRIEEKAQAVLDARKNHPNATLADLYDPLTMPRDLLAAHHALDRAVDEAYGVKGFESEADRVAYLFEKYRELIEKERLEKGGSKRKK